LGADAHDSPEHVVKALTERLAKEGESAALYYRRGVEHRVLGALAESTADLQKALNLDPNHIPARRELTRVLLDRGRTEEALRTVNWGLRNTPDEPAMASLLRARAEVLVRRGDFEKALADCQRALEAHPADLDGYLLRGRIQARLRRHQEAAEGYHDGYVRTGSFVLKNQWIESLIDAGYCRRALQEIESELAQTRWKSSWLLRRAHARICLQDRSEAMADLRDANEEINARLHPRRPDFTLLADRGLAYALLGETDRARRDLSRAEDAGAEDWVLERLRDALNGRSL
jgi:tetratricopeptide (TPR) repeat protein